MTTEAIRAGLVGFCVFGAFLLFAVCLAITISRALEETNSRLGKADRNVLAILVALFTTFAGAKHTIMPNTGADENISLVSIEAEYDSTNDVTALKVKFTGNSVGTLTPVSVRNDQSEPWRELEKIGASVTVDLPTNILSFAVAGNATTNRFWWVGTETLAVIVEISGIEIVLFAASSQSVQIMWNCDDPNATSFIIQRRRKGTAEWETVGVTSSFAFVYVGFTVGETWEWRVISIIAEDDE